jgi:hypothetical protein
VNKSRRNEVGRACSTYGGKEECIQRGVILVIKPKATVSLERPRRRCEGCIKMDLEEMESKMNCLAAQEGSV